ncbi:reverse transcriptase domain-containing protein [Tanacetum coccineum]
MEGNFMIPCNVGGTKDMSALVDQGSDVNIMPLSVYNRLTDKKLVETDVRLALASNSHIYPLGVAEDVLVEVTGFVYPVDFMILDIKKDVKKPLILGTPFFTTARVEIKFDNGTISLRLECVYTVYLILPAIPNQSRIIWEVELSDLCGDRSVPAPGGILQKLEAFVASPIGCGGSDVGIA